MGARPGAAGQHADPSGSGLPEIMRLGPPLWGDESFFCAGGGAEICRFWEDFFMSLWEILLLGLGLAMDAFAVSVCKGMAVKDLNFKKALIVGLWFGVAQAVMPMLGYALGVQFREIIESFDHWIAFGLLLFIGGKMIFEGVRNKEEGEDDSLLFSKMFLLAVATSIDALAVGITFAFLQVEVFSASAVIGVLTLACCVGGCYVGRFFGDKLKNKAEIAGGVVLVLIGVKILLEHLGILVL